MKKSLVNQTIQLGVCYYPEHWNEELWEDDFKRMKDLNFSVVRMAEFAWSIFEPEEAQFSFEFFDRVLDLAHQYGLKVVLGTPTATPPAWLTYKYPEVLNVSQEGVQYQHGQRRHYNYNSPIYQELSARIVEKMAEHYKSHPAVIGWQIDNELNCEINVFYSEADHTAFRSWVKNKYDSLEKLNQAWGTVFWNQTYTEWEQVHLTRPTVSDSPNPHQALDEKRFISDSAISYAELQEKIIRKHVGDKQWVTTNGLFGHLDNHKMTDELLDFFAYDSYPNFSTIYPDTGEKPLLDRKWSWNLSTVRSISPNFAVFEQQSGPGGWVNRMEQPSPKPGQMRLWTYQSIANGADMVLYFRWRTATMGTEIYWHGLNDYHNQPNRRIKEVSQISEELQKIGEKIAGSTYKAEVAILKDYENEWDGELDLWHGPLEQKSVMAWFKALQYNHVPVDAFYLSQDTSINDLEGYKVLIYPHPTILTEETASLLQEFAEQGGTVIFGCRTGYKNLDGQCYMKPFPGPVSSLCGVTVEDFSLVGPYENAPSIQMDGEQLSADSFIEALKVESEEAEVIARFAEGYMSEKPVLVKNPVGKGASYYYGSTFTLGTAEKLLSLLNISTPIDWVKAPEAVEIAIRKKENNQPFVFLLNYSNQEQEITLLQEATNMLTGDRVSGSVVMEAYGVMVLEGK
ncbi:beta-galactosidase [Litchfieldia alkalitelluris]|uniref:beta-galactosidase n=1 Tax=Litchfieldia alkalitelluris TaxID=304268 RepID=UPI000996EF33|nr:beta-galactosidase [Litchfieldia alkalitelluris]